MTNMTTVIGNLARDPELRYTPQGKAVVSLSVADTPRNLDRTTNQWVDGVTDWVNVTAWNNLAENAAASLKKGNRVVVMGTYKAEQYNDKTTGELKTTRKLVATEISPSLAFATAVVQPVNRNTNMGGGTANNSAATGGGGYTQQPFNPSGGDEETPF